MSLFDEELPTAYEYNGKSYEMHTDFREWIRFELLMTDPDILPQKSLPCLQGSSFPLFRPTRGLMSLSSGFTPAEKSRLRSRTENPTYHNRRKRMPPSIHLSMTTAIFMRLFLNNTELTLQRSNICTGGNSVHYSRLCTM